LARKYNRTKRQWAKKPPNQSNGFAGLVISQPGRRAPFRVCTPFNKPEAQSVLSDRENLPRSFPDTVAFSLQPGHLGLIKFAQ
jgi:hypothetical protein